MHLPYVHLCRVESFACFACSCTCLSFIIARAQEWAELRKLGVAEYMINQDAKREMMDSIYIGVTVADQKGKTKWYTGWIYMYRSVAYAVLQWLV